MKHFIITRFNYPAEYKQYKERIELFNKFTKRSLLLQTNKNFVYIVLGTPDVDLSGLNYVFINPLENENNKVFKFSDSVRSYIKSVSEPNELIITTRLDNDDYILNNYVDVIQKSAVLKHQYPFVIEPRGYLYDLRVKMFKTNDRYKNGVTSPFISFVEINNDNLLLCYCKNHSKMGKSFETLRLTSFIYVQIIHNSNWTMNKVRFEDFEGEKINNIPTFTTT